MTRDLLILLALRERETQLSHKINYVNEWILSITKEFDRQTHPSILRLQSRDKSNGCEGLKTMFQKRISNNLNCTLRSVLKNIHFGLY